MKSEWENYSTLHVIYAGTAVGARLYKKREFRWILDGRRWPGVFVLYVYCILAAPGARGVSGGIGKGIHAQALTIG